MTTSIGTKLYIASGKPTTEDQSGYEAQSWVQFKGVLSIPEFGDTQDDITSTLLETGRTKHSVGAKTIGNLVIPYKEVSPDAGYDDFEAAAGDDTDYSFKVVYNSGKTKYCYGLVCNHQDNEASPSSEAGGSFEIRPNSGEVVVNV